jgi:hypothetical protein
VAGRQGVGNPTRLSKRSNMKGIGSACSIAYASNISNGDVRKSAQSAGFNEIG